MDLYEFDRQYRVLGFSTIAGLDEAGRGPLAGPVVAGAVILPTDLRIEGLNDSKRLTQKQRERLYDEILTHAICYSIGVVSNDDIDNINILEASRLAMKRAISTLTVKPQLLIIDAIHLPTVYIPQVSVIKGDAKSASVAAASIIAKVSRDRIMDEMHKIYPQYGFNKHKGYPTKQHYLAIMKHGISPIHRKTFNIKNPHII